MEGFLHPSLIYQPLDTQAQEIRTVTIFPSSFDSPVKCNLNHVSLQSTPVYDALSYTWGDLGDRASLTLSGHELPITASLERALRYLRLPHTERTLWIDSICINQADIPERNQQVQSMGLIYRSARTVRAWIGREHEDEDTGVGNIADFRPLSQRAVPMSTIMAGEASGSSADLGDDGDRWTPWKLLVVFGSDAEHPNVLDAEHGCRIAPGAAATTMVAAIERSFGTRSGVQSWRQLVKWFRRPYWSRAWVQQELFAPDAITVHCGAGNAPYALFVRVALAANYCDSSWPKFDRPEGSELVSACARVYMLAMRKRFRERVLSESGVLGLLYEQTFNQASDPKDKVYSLLDLIQRWHEGRIAVDYSASTAEVYSGTVRAIVDVFKSLDVLDHVSIPQKWRRSDLPSWCPDWSRSVSRFEPEAMEAYAEFSLGHLPYNLGSWQMDYSASNSTGAKVSFSACGRILTAEGVLLDTIATISNPLDLQRDTGSFKHVKEIALGGHGFDAAAQAFEHEEVEACWRTLVSDRHWDSSHPTAPSTFGAAFSAFCHEDAWISASDPIPAVILDALPPEILHAVNIAPDHTSAGQALKEFLLPFLRSSIMASKCRRFLVSQKRYFGLCPAESRSGDILVVLWGRNIPVVLRPVEEMYNFVGQCYVHGWMHGKAVREVEAGRLDMKRFAMR